MTVGERLKYFIRNILGSNDVLADILGVSKQTISLYNTDKTALSLDHLLKLLNIGCNINWLLSGEGSMFADNEAGQALQSRVEADIKAMQDAYAKYYIDKHYITTKVNEEKREYKSGEIPPNLESLVKKIMKELLEKEDDLSPEDVDLKRSFIKVAAGRKLNK